MDFIFDSLSRDVIVFCDVTVRRSGINAGGAVGVKLTSVTLHYAQVPLLGVIVAGFCCTVTNIVLLETTPNNRNSVN